MSKHRFTASMLMGLLLASGCGQMNVTATPAPDVQAEMALADATGLLDAQAAPGPNYVIGPGDVLSIAVWRDETLSGTVVVLPDGTFSFPLVGEIRADGKTVARLKADLVEKIDKFVPDPVLTVGVQQVNSLRFFIIGKVNGPGAYPIIADTNVLQALSLAHGLTQFADRSKIIIMRQENGQTTMYPFNYKEVVKGEKLEQNIVLKKGDVIVVP